MPRSPSSQTTTTIKKLMGGKLRLERRNQNPMIYARTYLQGKNLVYRTEETRIRDAAKIAEDWWFGLRDRVQKGERIHDRTFAEAAERFLHEAHRDHNEGQVRNFRQKWSLLRKYFADKKPADIDKAFLLWLRGERAKALTKNGERVKPATLKKDLLFVRLVLRYARDEMKCLKELPDFPPFRRNSKWEILPAPRPRFTRSEFKRLLRFAWLRMRERGLNPRTRRQRTELYYFILIATGAALRVDEAYSLRWCDCEWYLLDSSDLTEAGKRGLETTAASLLKLMVLGKHSRGAEREEARGNSLAFFAYVHLKRLRAIEAGAAQADVNRLADFQIQLPAEEKVFRNRHRDGFRELLVAANLRHEQSGNRRMRNLKSLRPTGISLRLEESINPNYIDIAQWTRTSVAMIEKFYDQRKKDDAMARVMAPRARPTDA